jgi:hypothetical protein
LGASAEVVEVVLGGVLLVLLGLLVDEALLVALVAGVELELDELAPELVELALELLLELVDEGLDDELVDWPEGLVQLASGSTYCWLPADGVHPLWASAAELIVRPSASDRRMPRTTWDKRVTAAIEAMLENERAVTPCGPPISAARRVRPSPPV